MRVTADIRTRAFLRRESQRGAFPTVLKIGDRHAGAIYILEDSLKGTLNLYGPAPQTFINDKADDRKSESVLTRVAEDEVTTYLDKQRNFDPDIWIIETQCLQGPPSITLAHVHNPLYDSF